jgi:hypothetical protein
MNIQKLAVPFIFLIFFLSLAPCSIFAAEANPYYNPLWRSSDSESYQLGDCRIRVLHTYYWRDWMPIVSSPGPDGGSPLRAKINLAFDNSKGGDNSFSFQVVIMDSKGQSYPVPFKILPNYRVLPEDVVKSYRDMNEEAKKAAIVQYNVFWNGRLKAGEIREVVLATSEGPYLPVKSRIQAEITWTDEKGNVVKVKTAEEPINRTD